MMNDTMDCQNWSSIRAQFKLHPEYVHISNFFLASNPKPVRDALARHREAFDSNPYTYLEDHMFAQPQNMVWRDVCAAAAQYIGGRPEEVALTTSTTQGLALIYNGLRIEPGQEILTTTQEWYTHDEAMRLAVNKGGGSVRRFELYKDRHDVEPQALIERVIDQIRPETRIVAMTWVHSGTGVRLPIREMGARIKVLNEERPDNPLLFVVDGVHGFGCVDQDVASLNCDFFASGTHKWILGPHGTGVVWAPLERWELIFPTIPTIMAPELNEAWRAEREPEGKTKAAWVSPGGFLAFENQWAMIEAFKFVQAIGRKRIADRVAELNGQLKRGLLEIPGLLLHTPLEPEQSAGIVCCEVEGQTPRQVVDRLKAEKIIASATPYRHSTVRFSAGIVNTPEEIERTLDAMRRIAGAP